MARREFSRKVRAEIVLRATGADGVVCCEGCGLRLGKKPYEIDHAVAEALVMDKTKPLTANDGRLLGRQCCHKFKTRNDIRAIRKSDRVRDKASGAFKPSYRPIPGSRASGIRKRMSGAVEKW